MKMIYFEDPTGERSHSEARLAQVTRAVEFMAKYGAAIGLTALATAFLYDSVFWWIVDSRVLGYFVVSDHIQTAVRIISVLVVAMMSCAILLLAISLVGTRLIRLADDKKKTVLWVGVSLAAIGVLASSAFAYLSAVRVEEVRANSVEVIGWSTNREKLIRDVKSLDGLRAAAKNVLNNQATALPLDRKNALRANLEGNDDVFGNAHFRSKWAVYLGAFFIVVIVVAGMAAGTLLRDNKRLWQVVETHPLRYLLGGWIALTAYLAFSESILIGQGVFIRASAGTDIVSLEHDGQDSTPLSATLVRVIDKGVILRDIADGRIVFLPKDRIHRIDQDVRTTRPAATTDAAPTP